MANWPSGQRSASSTRTLPPASSTRRVSQGVGTQAPTISPLWKAVRVSALAWGLMETSPPPVVSVVRPCSASQVRRATSWVLPSWGEATILPFRSAASVDLGLHDELGAAGGGAGHDAHGLAVRLLVGVHRRVGPDVGDVEGVGEERLGGLGAGVEGLGLERGAEGLELLGEQALLHADQGGGVGDVREVAEAHRDRVAGGQLGDGEGGAGRRRSTTRSSRRRPGAGRERRARPARRAMPERGRERELDTCYAFRKTRSEWSCLDRCP